MTDKATEGPDHGKLLRQFEEAFDDTQDARRDSERDRDYYDGIQWTAEEVEALNRRKQPVVTSNRIKPKIDALLGFEKRQRTDPRAYPRTPQHEQDAQSATDAIRFVCDQNRFQMIRSDAAENMFVEGIAAATVTVKAKSDGTMDVSLHHVPWDRFYYDPHSRRRDFSDANYMGTVLWMDEADAKALARDAAAVDACYDDAAEGETYDDRPKVSWSDKSRKRVRVIQPRWREGGQWMTAIVCRGGFLRDPQPSPFLDEDGVPECDLIAASAYVDRENNRYGVVRQMISPQDEINKRRSKALHLLNSRLIVADHGAVADVEQTRREAARPDGYIEKMQGSEFVFPDHQGLVAGQLQLLQEAKGEIDSSGVNPALEGDLQAPSGRAVEALTQAGLAEQAVIFDSLRDWSWRVYRATWHRIRQYWTDERWVRVTDDERNMKWVAVNKVDPMTGQVQAPLSELDVDLILEDGPDSVTIQSEQYEMLVELKRADPAAIPTQAVIEASSLRNKDKLLDMMQQGGIPPQIQAQMKQMQEALQEAQQQLEQAKGDTQIRMMELQLKAAEQDVKREELRVKQYEAETARMEKVAPVQDVPDGWARDAFTPQIPDGMPV